MKRVHIIISGDVEGVGFRYNIYARALLGGIKGWVKNLGNGDLEAVFEGEKEKIEKILYFCKNGPFLAKVTGIKIKAEDYKGENKFEILK